ncbi:malonyl-coenzyme A:anthocyanin 3-O-glucoside-6''-O-malonyltransferase-like [Tasmannia lanceolata]|uniref:malonyl-coenzyme A:anthocyanin 3-O-glucoside-6''-O-malonyltransferase-like n=1 Tax=Tasmannia lanceolata TaxID=3420 RepID=UPI0040639E14
MAPPHTIQVLRHIRVSPPPGSVTDNSLILTFFDVQGLIIPPVQHLFFYQHPHPSTHFLNTLLPTLEHSLSLSLQLFYPLAGHLILSPDTREHEIRYINGDLVSLTIAESDADFHKLTTNLPRDATQLHHLIPPLPTSDNEKMPLLALQVTLFPNSGICIGTSIHHAIVDGSSFIHFMKSWASICNSGGDLSLVSSLPIFDRTLSLSLDHIKRKFFMDLEKVKFNESTDELKEKIEDRDVVLATFMLGRGDIERLKQWVLARVKPSCKLSHYSSFVLTCAHVWICQVKARNVVGEKRVHFVNAMDCRGWLDPPLSDGYFGNCFGSGFAEANASNLCGENGLVVALEAIKGAILRMKEGVLKDAELWIQKFLSLSGEWIISADSPKFRMYEINFGWRIHRKAYSGPALGSVPTKFDWLCLIFEICKGSEGSPQKDSPEFSGGLQPVTITQVRPPTQGARRLKKC